MTLHVRSIGRHALALDRASERTFDADGRLHVGTANISKAAVNPYVGSEFRIGNHSGWIPIGNTNCFAIRTSSQRRRRRS
jgi:hypothetical protein